MSKRAPYVIVLVVATLSVCGVYISNTQKLTNELGRKVVMEAAEVRLSNAPNQLPIVDETSRKIDHQQPKPRPTQSTEVVTRGIFGSPLGVPWKTYAENITAAELGDPAAQFEVSRVLFECKGLPTQQRFNELIDSGQFAPDFAAEVRSKMDTCAELIDNLSSEESGLWNYWLQESAINGSVIGRGRHMIFAPSQYTPSETLSIIRSVVRESDVEKYAIVVSYFANYREVDVIQYEAWMLLACEKISECDIGRYRGEGQAPLRPNEQELVETTADQIRSALADGRWDDIQL